MEAQGLYGDWTKARIDGVVYEFDQKRHYRKSLKSNIVPRVSATTNLSEVTDDAA